MSRTRSSARSREIDRTRPVSAPQLGGVGQDREEAHGRHEGAVAGRAQTPGEDRDEGEGEEAGADRPHEVEQPAPGHRRDVGLAFRSSSAAASGSGSRGSGVPRVIRLGGGEAISPPR